MALSASATKATQNGNTSSIDLKSLLIQTLGKAKFDLWFGAATIDLKHGKLRVAVANRFAADWISSRFKTVLAEVGQQHAGEAVEIDVRVDENLPTPSHLNASATSGNAPPAPPAGGATAGKVAPPSPTAAPTAGPTTTAGGGQPQVELRYDLDDFVVGPSNELAYTGACRAMDRAEHGMNPLFIHGGCGLGKTHLLQGLCKRYRKQNPEGRWVYTTAEQFTNEYISAVRGNRLGQFRRKLRRLDLLALDDVHFLANKSGTQTEFLHTFNAIDLQGARIVMASDAHPKLIQQFSEALVSRFVSGMVVQIHSPDAQTRQRLVTTLADRRQLRLTESAVQRLVAQPVDSVRELEGMITRISAIASLDRQRRDQPVDLSLLDQVLDSSTQPTPRPVPVEKIIQLVCERLAVERSSLMGRGRHRRVVLARSLVIYLARQLTTLSYPELARALGRTNHSTIVTASQRVEQQIQQQAPLPLSETYDCRTVDQLAIQLRREVVAAVQSSLSS